MQAKDIVAAIRRALELWHLAGTKGLAAPFASLFLPLIFFFSSLLLCSSPDTHFLTVYLDEKKGKVSIFF